MEDTLKRSPLDLQEELTRRTGRRVRLILNDNRSNMVSARRREAGWLEVRLQRMFLEAPAEVVDDLVDILSGRRTAKAALRAFVDSRTAAFTRVARPPSPERSESAHHDIAGYARGLNSLYLGDRSRALVIWGRRNKTRSRRSIRFASYDPSRNLITMNRKLDSPEIPRYFVEFVLFHEMLHEVLGIGEKADGRRDIHGSLFKLMESTFPDYDKALRYERDLCRRLWSL